MAERRYRKGIERHFAEYARTHGWAITKRGMPDFWCFKGAYFAVVVCKPWSEGGVLVRRDEARTLEELSARGIECYVFSPAGMERYEKYRHSNEAIRKERQKKVWENIRKRSRKWKRKLAHPVPQAPPNPPPAVG